MRANVVQYEYLICNKINCFAYWKDFLYLSNSLQLFNVSRGTHLCDPNSRDQQIMGCGVGGVSKNK